MGKARFAYLLSIFLAAVTVFSSSAVASGAELERGISLSTPYTSIAIARNQSVTLPIEVANRGEVGELDRRFLSNVMRMDNPFSRIDYRTFAEREKEGR